MGDQCSVFTKNPPTANMVAMWMSEDDQFYDVITQLLDFSIQLLRCLCPARVHQQDAISANAGYHVNGETIFS